MNHNKLKKILYLLLVVLLLLAAYLIINFQPQNNNVEGNKANVEVTSDEEESDLNNEVSEEGGEISLDRVEKYLELEEEGEDLTMVRRDMAMRERQGSDSVVGSNTELNNDGPVLEEGQEIVEYSAPEGRENPIPFPNLEDKGLHFMNEEDKEILGIESDDYFQILSWNEDGSINSYAVVKTMEDIVYPE